MDKKLAIFQVWSIKPHIKTDLESYEFNDGNVNVSYCNSVIIIQKPDSIDNTVLIVPIANKAYSKYTVAISGAYIGLDKKDIVYVISDKIFHIGIDNLIEHLSDLNINDRQSIGLMIKDKILPRFVGSMLI